MGTVRFYEFSLKRDCSSLKTEAPRLSDNSNRGKGEFYAILAQAKVARLGENNKSLSRKSKIQSKPYTIHFHIITDINQNFKTQF